MDINKIEELIKVLESSRTQELAVRKADCLVCLRKGHKPRPAAPLRKQAKSAELFDEAAGDSSGQCHILAPMVGIFYKVDGVATVGAAVELGQVVGAIESMKLLNDVVASVSGTVCEVLVEDGTAVEYGQPLCRIGPVEASAV